MVERLFHRLGLLCRKQDAKLPLCFLYQKVHLNVPGFLLHQEGYQPFCCPALKTIKLSGIQSPVLVIQLLLGKQLVNAVIHLPLCYNFSAVAVIQLLMNRFLELLLVDIQMSVLRFLFKAVMNAALDPHGVVWSALICLCNLIHSQKSEAVYLTKLKGLVLNGFQGICPKMFVNLFYFLGSYFEGSQIGCKVTHGVSAVIG